MDSSSTCSIPNCGKPTRARGWCNAHWTRWSRYGDPLAGQQFRDAALRYLHEVVIPHEDSENCLPWPYNKTSDGYGRIGINGKRVATHRLVCSMVHGAAPSQGHEAAHSCGNGHLGCVNPHHLSWKTRSENFADKLTHDTHNRGERNGYAKITEAQARQALMLKGAASQRKIDKLTGISASNVAHIHRGDSWSWLK